MPWRRKLQPTPVLLTGESPWTAKPGGLQSVGLQGSNVNKHIYYYFPLKTSSGKHTLREAPPLPSPTRSDSLCIFLQVPECYIVSVIFKYFVFFNNNSIFLNGLYDLSALECLIFATDLCISWFPMDLNFSYASIPCFTVLYRSYFFFFFFYKWKICGNSALRESISTIFPTAFVHFVSLCHSL